MTEIVMCIIYLFPSKIETINLKNWLCFKYVISRRSILIIGRFRVMSVSRIDKLLNLIARLLN